MPGTFFIQDKKIRYPCQRVKVLEQEYKKHGRFSVTPAAKRRLFAVWILQTAYLISYIRELIYNLFFFRRSRRCYGERLVGSRQHCYYQVCGDVENAGSVMAPATSLPRVD